MMLLKGGLDVLRRKTAVFAILFTLVCFQLGYFAVQRFNSQSSIDYQPFKITESSNITVNLVIASLKADDISWTSKLDIPNLQVIRYISDYDEYDEGSAKYHPPVPKKGREATIYHTYFHDFYDKLPDISIMTHAEENPWHIDGVLQQSMLFTLSHLDLQEVMKRKYANLRVMWEHACPDWINTTKTPEESFKQEEPFMREAWTSNFGGTVKDVPEILAGPCCSQFAVTRDAVRRHGREQYRRNRDWMLATEWSDYIAGRTWEHMFPFLLSGQPTDCPAEWNAYCAMYHVCFDRRSTAQKYNRLWKERKDLREQTEFLNGLIHPQAALAARQRIGEIDQILKADIEVALERGKDDDVRRKAAKGMFSS